MGMFADNSLDALIAIDTWKGNSKMRPCFAAIRNNGVKQTSQELYDTLAEARGDRNKDRIDAIMRDAVSVLAETLTGVPADVVDVTIEQVKTENDF